MLHKNSRLIGLRKLFWRRALRKGKDFFVIFFKSLENRLTQLYEVRAAENRSTVPPNYLPPFPRIKGRH